MAPEIVLDKPYQGNSVDIFALGVIFFNCYTGFSPFSQATTTKGPFKYLVQGRADKFWKHQSQYCKFSDSFKDLITNMLQPVPHQRISMADLIGHPWINGPAAELSDVQQEFYRRIKKTEEERKLTPVSEVVAFKGTTRCV